MGCGVKSEVLSNFIKVVFLVGCFLRYGVNLRQNQDQTKLLMISDAFVRIGTLFRFFDELLFHFRGGIFI